MRPTCSRALATPSALLLLASAVCLSSNAQYNPAAQKPPQVQILSASEVSHQLASLAHKGKLNVYSATSFNQHLFLGTAAGLLELDANGVATLTRFHHTTTDSIWTDPANHALWAFDEKAYRLLRLHDGQWQAFALPDVPDTNRGDLLRGVSLAGNANGLWMTWAGAAWRWQPGTEIWQRLDQPRQLTIDAGILPLDSSPLIVVKHRSLLDNTHDQVLDTANHFANIPNHAGQFSAESWASFGDAGYICTSKHALLKVTRAEIILFIAPGPCDALSSDPSGGLIASFGKLGIFQHTAADGWHLIATAPPSPASGHYAAFVTSNGIQAAFGIFPVISGTDNGKGGLTYRDDTHGGLWFAPSGQLLPLP